MYFILFLRLLAMKVVDEALHKLQFRLQLNNKNCYKKKKINATKSNNQNNKTQQHKVAAAKLKTFTFV